MSDRFRGSFFDLSLDLRSGRRLVDDDAELVVVDEEAARHPLSVRVERDGLDSEIADVTADDDTNEAEQAARNRGHVLGAVLHGQESKHGPSSRKGSKSPRKITMDGSRADTG